jgi:hypothetical protein
MSRILKVNNGDYRIKVTAASPSAASPAIILDTGDGVGTVTVTGNLDVKGVTTTIDSVTTTVKDNIITLNHDTEYTGAGISNLFYYQAGIAIERGSLPAAMFVYNEQVQHYDAITHTSMNGTFVAKTADNALSGIQVRTITNDGSANLAFDLRNSSSTLRIANSASYESLVLDDNDIPNRKFVTDYFATSFNSGSFSGIQFPLDTNAPLSKVETTVSGIDFTVGSSVRGSYGTAGLQLDNILVSMNSITNNSANALTLSAYNGVVRVDATMQLRNGSSVYYTTLRPSDSIGLGGTGLYTQNGTGQEQELISARKALIFSIIF